MFCICVMRLILIAERISIRILSTSERAFVFLASPHFLLYTLYFSVQYLFGLFRFQSHPCPAYTAQFTTEYSSRNSAVPINCSSTFYGLVYTFLYLSLHGLHNRALSVDSCVEPS